MSLPSKKNLPVRVQFSFFRNMPIEDTRPSALKHGLSKDVVSTSPLQAPGLKAAKIQDKSEANVSMPAGVPSLPGSGSTVPVSSGGVAEQGGPGSSGGGGSGGVPGVGGGAFGGSLSPPTLLVGGDPGLAGRVSETGGDLLAGGKKPAKTFGEDDDEDVSLKSLLKEMRRMNTNIESVDSKFDKVQAQIDTLKSEVSTLQADSVTKIVHNQLESRVSVLEAACPQSAEVTFLKEQVNRLDPCHRSLCFKSFKSDLDRTASIQKYLEQSLGKPRVQSVEHIYGWSKGVRKISPVSIVEFTSRADRDMILKRTEENPGLKDDLGAEIIVQRAKSAVQRKRNAALLQVADLLKKKTASEGATVEILWQIKEPDGAKTKDRGVQVGNTVVFKQGPTEMTGRFSETFAGLQF